MRKYRNVRGNYKKYLIIIIIMLMCSYLMLNVVLYISQQRIKNISIEYYFKYITPPPSDRLIKYIHNIDTDHINNNVNNNVNNINNNVNNINNNVNNINNNINVNMNNNNMNNNNMNIMMISENVKVQNWFDLALNSLYHLQYYESLRYLFHATIYDEDNAILWCYIYYILKYKVGDINEVNNILNKVKRLQSLVNNKHKIIYIDALITNNIEIFNIKMKELMTLLPNNYEYKCLWADRNIYNTTNIYGYPNPYKNRYNVQQDLKDIIRNSNNINNLPDCIIMLYLKSYEDMKSLDILNNIELPKESMSIFVANSIARIHVLQGLVDEADDALKLVDDFHNQYFKNVKVAPLYYWHYLENLVTLTYNLAKSGRIMECKSFIRKIKSVNVAISVENLRNPLYNVGVFAFLLKALMIEPYMYYIQDDFDNMSISIKYLIDRFEKTISIYSNLNFILYYWQSIYYYSKAMSSYEINEQASLRKHTFNIDDKLAMKNYVRQFEQYKDKSIKYSRYNQLNIQTKELIKEALLLLNVYNLELMGLEEYLTNQNLEKAHNILTHAQTAQFHLPINMNFPIQYIRPVSLNIAKIYWKEKYKLQHTEHLKVTIKLLDDIMKQYPMYNIALIYFYQAKNYGQLGNFESSRHYMKKVLELKPDQNLRMTKMCKRYANTLKKLL